jgi:signal transduction histidine kinase
MVRSDGTMVYKDKKEHDVIVYRQGIVNADSRLIGTLGIIIDISDIKKAERDLQNSQKKLKEAIAAKDKFFNIMAHDLKNPFNAIMGLTSLLTEQFDKHSKEDLRQFVVLINQSTTNVYSLLENLLEWARAQSGSIDIHPATFPIVDIIQETLNLFSQSLERKNVSINIDKTEYLVYADKNMTKTIFRNLLSNAIKYSFNDSFIDIKLDKADEWLYIRVEDHGVGIKAESIDNIFKIDKPTTTPGVNNERGTGLGLIICQEFVKLNGGTMLVQSEPGKGSQFTFTLPLVM